MERNKQCEFDSDETYCEELEGCVKQSLAGNEHSESINLQTCNLAEITRQPSSMWYCKSRETGQKSISNDDASDLNYDLQITENSKRKSENELHYSTNWYNVPEKDFERSTYDKSTGTRKTDSKNNLSGGMRDHNNSKEFSQPLFDTQVVDWLYEKINRNDVEEYLNKNIDQPTSDGSREANDSDYSRKYIDHQPNFNNSHDSDVTIFEGAESLNILSKDTNHAETNSIPLLNDANQKRSNIFSELSDSSTCGNRSVSLKLVNKSVIQNDFLAMKLTNVFRQLVQLSNYQILLNDPCTKKIVVFEEIADRLVKIGFNISGEKSKLLASWLSGKCVNATVLPLKSLEINTALRPETDYYIKKARRKAVNSHCESQNQNGDHFGFVRQFRIIHTEYWNLLSSFEAMSYKSIYSRLTDNIKILDNVVNDSVRFKTLLLEKEQINVMEIGEVSRKLLSRYNKISASNSNSYLRRRSVESENIKNKSAETVIVQPGRNLHDASSNETVPENQQYIISPCRFGNFKVSKRYENSTNQNSNKQHPANSHDVIFSYSLRNTLKPVNENNKMSQTTRKRHRKVQSNVPQNMNSLVLYDKTSQETPDHEQFKTTNKMKSVNSKNKFGYSQIKKSLRRKGYSLNSEPSDKQNVKLPNVLKVKQPKRDLNISTNLGRPLKLSLKKFTKKQKCELEKVSKNVKSGDKYKFKQKLNPKNCGNSLKKCPPDECGPDLRSKLRSYLNASYIAEITVNQSQKSELADRQNMKPSDVLQVKEARDIKIPKKLGRPPKLSLEKCVKKQKRELEKVPKNKEQIDKYKIMLKKRNPQYPSDEYGLVTRSKYKSYIEENSTTRNVITQTLNPNQPNKTIKRPDVVKVRQPECDVTLDTLLPLSLQKCGKKQKPKLKNVPKNNKSGDKYKIKEKQLNSRNCENSLEKCLPDEYGSSSRSKRRSYLEKGSIAEIMVNQPEDKLPAVNKGSDANCLLENVSMQSMIKPSSLIPQNQFFEEDYVAEIMANETAYKLPAVNQNTYENCHDKNMSVLPNKAQNVVNNILSVVNQNVSANSSEENVSVSYTLTQLSDDTVDSGLCLQKGIDNIQKVTKNIPHTRHKVRTTIKSIKNPCSKVQRNKLSIGCNRRKNATNMTKKLYDERFEAFEDTENFMGPQTQQISRPPFQTYLITGQTENILATVHPNSEYSCVKTKENSYPMKNLSQDQWFQTEPNTDCSSQPSRGTHKTQSIEHNQYRNPHTSQNLDNSYLQLTSSFSNYRNPRRPEIQRNKTDLLDELTKLKIDFGNRRSNRRTPNYIKVYEDKVKSSNHYNRSKYASPCIRSGPLNFDVTSPLFCQYRSKIKNAMWRTRSPIKVETKPYVKPSCLNTVQRRREYSIKSNNSQNVFCDFLKIRTNEFRYDQITNPFDRITDHEKLAIPKAAPFQNKVFQFNVKPADFQRRESFSKPQTSSSIAPDFSKIPANTDPKTTPAKKEEFHFNGFTQEYTPVDQPNINLFDSGAHEVENVFGYWNLTDHVANDSNEMSENFAKLLDANSLLNTVKYIRVRPPHYVPVH